MRICWGLGNKVRKRLELEKRPMWWGCRPIPRQNIPGRRKSTCVFFLLMKQGHVVLQKRKAELSARILTPRAGRPKKLDRPFRN